MNIIMIGCEFTGKTTLSTEIVYWIEENMGDGSHFHDHFTIPSTELSAEAAVNYQAADPQVKEMLQRYMITYHISPGFYNAPDHHLMGVHIEEAVYAPLYYGYGGPDSGSPKRSPEGQRTKMARHMEQEILEFAPNSVLVLMKATPEVIRNRMAENFLPDAEPVARQVLSKQDGEPTRGVVEDKDVEYVLARFEEEFEASLIKNKLVLDTTTSTVEESLAEFLESVQPFLSDADKARLEAKKSD